MSKPESFTATTDFATLKNDNFGSVSITIPASVSIPNTGVGSTYTLSASFNVGVKGAVSRTRITSGRYGITTAGPLLISNSTGVYSGSPANYAIYAFLSRSSATTITCYITIQGDGASPGSLTTANTPETFTFYTNTFIPPFA